MTRRRRIAAGLVLALTTIASCTSGGDSGGGDGDSNDCPEGSEGCPCLDGMCVGMLRCLSNRCVDDSATGGDGGTTSGSGGSNTGGSSGTTTGGTAGMSGTASGGTSGSASGGSAQGGNAGSGTSGTAGSGGTSGSNGASGGSGSAGGPLWSPCFRESDFTTCDAACASIAATCVAEGCDMVTWYAWGEGAPERCETMEAIQGFGLEACNVPLNWAPAQFVRRCCCGTT